MVNKVQAGNLVGQTIAMATKAGHTLLLLSGGSSIKVAIRALDAVDIKDRHNLFITLADERYGMRGHKNSNWQALVAAGLDFKKYAHYEPLWEETQSREKTAHELEKVIIREHKKAKTVIALLGIGKDNHTAGILPNSEAAKEDHHLVVDYDGPDFERITIAPPMFDTIDLVFVYTEGDTKKAAVEALYKNASAISQPAQLVKKAKHFTVLHAEM